MELDPKAVRPLFRRFFISLNLPISWLLKLYAASLKFPERPWLQIEKERPVLLALYHGELLPILLYGAHRGNIATIVSKHADGEIIAKVLNRLGYRTIRGSTDSGRNKGGSAALKGVLEALREGFHVAITVDGPKGPCCRVKDGILYASALSQRPIYPVRVRVRGFNLPSWDKFLIPLPFEKVEILLGKPILVESKEKLSHYRGLLEAELTGLV
jgi:lysophospholipid acyltransferase (LPLAT)-like uncharacterized protein